MARRYAWLLAALAALAGPATGQEAVNKALRELPPLVKKGNYGAAVEKLQRVEPQAEAAGKAQVQNALGYTLFLSGDYDRAVETLNSARDLAVETGDETTRIKALNNLGALEFTRGDLDAAEEAFRQAAAGGSSFAENYLDQIAAQRRTDRLNGLIDQGVRARLADDFKGAVTAYDQALEIDPQNARALNYRGYARFRLGDLAGAEQDFTHALEREPNAVLPRLNLLKVRCRTGSGDAALRKMAPRDERERSLYRSDGELRKVCGNRLPALLG